MLRFVLPTGSLADAVRKYLATAGYNVPQPERTGLCGVVNEVEFYQLDRRMIPLFLHSGEYDAGLTGEDLVLASGVTHLRPIARFNFSRASERPTKWVLAQKAGATFSTDRIVKIGCELPEFARRIVGERIRRYTIVPISGSEEQCVSAGIIDMVLVVTESGSSIKANGLEIVPGCENLFESMPVIVARPDIGDAENEALAALSIALRSVVGAKSHIMITFDFPAAKDVMELELPAAVAPTMAKTTNNEWNACTICVPIALQGTILAKISNAGGKSIVVSPVQGYIS